MKLLVSCDECCYKLNNKYYVGPTGILFIKRYLTAFDKITLAIRTNTVQNEEELGKINNPIPNENVTIIPMPFFQGPKQYAKVYFKVKKMAKMAARNCDLAILRLPSTTGFAIWHYLMIYRKPYATEVVFDCHDAYESATSFVEKILWSLMHKKQVKACNYAIGVSCVTGKYLQGHYFPLKTNAITTHYSSIELPPEYYHESRSFPESNSVSIIHVANQVELNSRKGHRELIQILTHIRKRGIDAHLIFVGESYKNGIEQLSLMAKKYNVDRYIEFTGYVQKDKLRQLLLKAHVAVLPTKAEGLPRVIIEAMALGLPCITTPVSGNPELIDTELLIPYNDIEGFCNVLIRLFSDQHFYEEQSKTNFNRSLQYSTNILNPRRTRFYENLIQLVKEQKI